MFTLCNLEIRIHRNFKDYLQCFNLMCNVLIEEAISLQNDLNTSNTIERRPKGSVQAERIEKLREKNKQLIEDKKAILEQNMILTKENNTLKRRLHDLEELLQQQRNLKVIQINNKD